MGVTPWVCLKCGVLQVPPIAVETPDGPRVMCTVVHSNAPHGCGGAVVMPDHDGGLGRVMPVQLN